MGPGREPSGEDVRYMELALDLARQGAAAGEVPVGAVVIREGSVLGRGFNRPISSHDPTAHAEMVALREAGAAAGNYRLTGTVLYATLEPCLMCVGAMVHARVARLVYGAPDPRLGAAALAGELADRHALNHRLDVTPGVLVGPCRELLRDYFRQRRG